MTLDIEAFRSQFPALVAGEAYFDGAGGTQTPAAVAEAIAGALRAPLSNRGAGSLAARNSLRGTSRTSGRRTATWARCPPRASCTAGQRPR